MGPVRQRLQAVPTWARVATLLLGASLCMSLLVGWWWPSATREAEVARVRELARATAQRVSPLLARGDALRLSVTATALADLTCGRVAFLAAEGSVLIDTKPGLGSAPDASGADRIEVLHEGRRAGELLLWPAAEPSQHAFAWGAALVVLASTLALAGLASALAHQLATRVRSASLALRDHANGRPVRLAGLGHSPAPEFAALDRALRQLGTVVTPGSRPVSAPVVELAQRLVLGLERQRVLAPGHADRTARHAGHLAERLGMIEEDRRDLDLACRLHELGKAWVRPGLLRKEGVWDDADRDSLRNHPARACSLLESVPGMQGVAAIVRSQCERHDGTGWPDGLRGDRIPLGARILAVASRYDLIRSGIHGWALDAAAALEQLRELRGSELDPWLVDLFAEAVHRTPDRDEDKAVRIGAAAAAAGYLLGPADRGDEEEHDDAAEIELMADGSAREGT